MNKDNIILVEKNKCTGCGLCAEICPASCINLKKDEYGFRYPSVNQQKCLECGKCINHCPANVLPQKSKSISAFLGKSSIPKILKSSASGGAFSSIAISFLNQNGVVYGCRAENSNEWVAKISRIDNIDSIGEIQGSKYYESDASESYELVKRDLQRGRSVLYGARPCQVAALINYLKGIDTNKLVTVDVVCHGIPSYEMFRDYINTVERKTGKKVIDYKFRSHKKNDDRGYFGQIEFQNSRGKKSVKPVLWQCDSYFYNFMVGNIYRESCYFCNYACRERVGDITLGDFWGVEKFFPKTHSGNISLILINTEKGRTALFSTKQLEIEAVDVDRACALNGPLNKPTNKPAKENERILRVFKDEGWLGVEKEFAMSAKIDKILARIVHYTPKWIKDILNR